MTAKVYHFPLPNLPPEANQALTEIVERRMEQTGETLVEAREFVAGFFVEGA